MVRRGRGQKEKRSVRSREIVGEVAGRRIRPEHDRRRAPSRGGVRRGRACAEDGEKARDLDHELHLVVLNTSVVFLEGEEGWTEELDVDPRLNT